MGCGARQPRARADSPVRDHVPVATAAYVRGRASLSQRLRTRGNLAAAQRQRARRKSVESGGDLRVRWIDRDWNYSDDAWLRRSCLHGDCRGTRRRDAHVWNCDGSRARESQCGAQTVARLDCLFTDRVAGAGFGSSVSITMPTMVTREERKEENWRTLKILIGVMVLLIAVSVVTIIVKH